MFAGLKAWPLDVRPSDLVPSVLAHHLALRCRWNCATVIFYSCAQHSLLVSIRAAQLALERGRPDRALLCARWGLIHDISDAILPDVPTPLKVLPEFTFFREAEREIVRSACVWLELPLEKPEEVKLADLEIRVTEARDLLDALHLPPQLPPGPYPLGVEKVDPLSGIIVAEAPWVAERTFRARWTELFPAFTPKRWDNPILPAVAR